MRKRELLALLARRFALAGSRRAIARELRDVDALLLHAVEKEARAGQRGRGAEEHKRTVSAGSRTCQRKSTQKGGAR